jgi:hypothetical protein
MVQFHAVVDSGLLLGPGMAVSQGPHLVLLRGRRGGAQGRADRRPRRVLLDPSPAHEPQHKSVLGGEPDDTRGARFTKARF